MTRFQKACGDVALQLGLFAGAVTVGLDLQACGAGPVEIAAPAAYLAEQLACVDQSVTRDEATACRNRVKARWAADAGADR